MSRRLLLIVAVLVFAATLFMRLKMVDCHLLSDDKKISCVKHRLDGFVAKHDYNSALDYLNDYREQDKVFAAKDCYPLTYYLGEKAFISYQQGLSFDWVDSASICNHGFYHAFMTNFASNNNLLNAQPFCDQLALKSASVGNSCYHGVGHGLVYVYAQDLGMTLLESMLAKGVAMCEQVFPGETAKIKECLGGVYGGLTDLAFKEESRYEDLSLETWYGLCGLQQEVYQSVCYENIDRIVFIGNGNDFSGTVDFIVNNSRITNKREAIKGLAAVFMAVNENDLSAQQQGLAVCQNLPIELKNDCIEMLSSKLFFLSSRSTRSQRVAEFCSFTSLTAKEKKICLFDNNEPLKQEFLNYE